MAEDLTEPAPSLGEATDAQDVADGIELDDEPPTIDTPDELGGTGGEQPGGAG